MDRTLVVGGRAILYVNHVWESSKYIHVIAFRIGVHTYNGTYVHI